MQKYASTVTCRDHAVLAVLYKEDYVRAANTAGVESVIGLFWEIGLRHSNDEVEEDGRGEEEKDNEVHSSSFEYKIHRF